MSIQSGGIDSPSIISSHVLTFQMLFNAREFDEAAKHMCAAIYLKDKYLQTALQFFQEA